MSIYTCSICGGKYPANGSHACGGHSQSGGENYSPQQSAIIPNEVLTHVPQMSLRDWFAGQFVSGCGAHHDYWAKFASEWFGDEVGFPGKTEASLIADIAYQLADAMLAERNK